MTVGELLQGMGYSLQAPAKENEGTLHPDRDAQFHHLNGQVEAHLAAGQPVISVDTKKKEVVGNLENGGREWQPAKRPVRVDVHDFPDPLVSKAVPYGVYDLAANEGFVVVGNDGDTAEFAVASISRWWDEVGCVAHPDATRLSSPRMRADRTDTEPACGRSSFPSPPQGRASRSRCATSRRGPRGGTGSSTACSAPISMNWRGRPLTSHEVIVDLIANTTTRAGLKVRARLDRGTYPRGIKVSDKELKAVPLTKHEFQGDWNYTTAPGPVPSATSM